MCFENNNPSIESLVEQQTTNSKKQHNSVKIGGKISKYFTSLQPISSRFRAELHVTTDTIFFIHHRTPNHPSRNQRVSDMLQHIIWFAIYITY
jgi:hypothetical protein